MFYHLLLLFKNKIDHDINIDTHFTVSNIPSYEERVKQPHYFIMAYLKSIEWTYVD